MNLRTIDSQAHRLTLALEGSLDLAGVEKIESAFLAAVTGRRGFVVLELSGVTFVASLGMRMFIKAHKLLAATGGSLILFRPTPITRKVLLHAGMESLFPIAETAAELSTLTDKS